MPACVTHDEVVAAFTRYLVRTGRRDLPNLVVLTPPPPGAANADCIHATVCGTAANPANVVAHLVAGTEAIGEPLYMATAHCDGCHAQHQRLSACLPDEHGAACLPLEADA